MTPSQNVRYLETIWDRSVIRRQLTHVDENERSCVTCVNKSEKSDYCQSCKIMGSRDANRSKNHKSFAATSLEGGNQTEHGNCVCTLDSSNSVRLVTFEKPLKSSRSVKFLWCQRE